jgi:hypothetical protein
MNQESSKIKNFTDLRAWQEGHQLVKSVYECTKDFPILISKDFNYLSKFLLLDS